SEAFIGKLGAGWDVTRAYVEGLGVSTARARLMDAIDQGAALTDFIGHSGLTVWTFSGLFNSRDVAALTNAGRPTVVTQWGCWNTYHVEPSYDGLGQRFLLEPDRGAAAVLGSATWTLAESDDALGRLIMPLLTEPGMPIGTAVVEAKQKLAATRPDLIDVQLGWTLLGDPALVAAVLAVNGVVLWVAERLRRRTKQTTARNDNLSYGQAALIGTFQAGALIPGLSRSGLTIGAGLGVGLSHVEAARFSFLLAAPIITGAAVLEVPKLLHGAAGGIGFGVSALGGLVAGITAFASVAFLMRFFRKHEFEALDPFAYYCMAAGVVFCAAFLGGFA
ncbi:MAG: undecaprenyl-diphosphate phosphatase, partial [Acidihalobacter sp.]